MYVQSKSLVRPPPPRKNPVCNPDVCTYVHIRTHAYACVEHYVSMILYMCVHTRVRMRVCVQANMCIHGTDHMCIHVHVHASECVCACITIHVCTCACMP